MIAFEVNDMTCGHCVRAITEAVHCADSGARVQVDLAAHRVQIEPVAAQASTLLDAIQQAGYTPTLLAASEPGPAASEPGPAAGHARGSTCGGGAGSGCGCGSR